MEILSKLKILSAAAKYDVSCSSSGSSRKNSKDGLGNAAISGICHSWSADGRCISLLKILLSNECVYDCTYCTNKITSDVERATFTPEEVVSLTMNFYKRNYIEGLFLSSAVYKSPDYTMELLIKTVQMLRDSNFNGYIHLKGIPGADGSLINKAGLFVDRMSVNIELPSETSLQMLAPQKKKESIIRPMALMKQGISINKEEKKIFRNNPIFLPAGQTTQLIVGASPEADLSILKLSEGLYKKFEMKRVYYSAYIPVVENNKLPSIQTRPPFLREHRLYQADWLLRFYGFNADELLNIGNPNFDLDLDPKCFWALENIHLFPLEVNNADYTELIRVPGIGVRSATKIIVARRVSKLDYMDLKKLGVVLKRAKYFITSNGKYYGGVSINPNTIKRILIDRPENHSTQLSIFNMFPNALINNELPSRIAGEF